MIILLPADGRNYVSGYEAQQDFKNGKDFINGDILSKWGGTRCSIKNFTKNTKFKIWFHNGQKNTIFKI